MKRKMNARFRDLQGGLFSSVTKADVGEGIGVFIDQGGDIMAWADPFFPDAVLPESVATAMKANIDSGMSGHYVMPIGNQDLRAALAARISGRTGLIIDPSRNIIVTPGSDTGLLFAMMPFLSEGDEVLVPDPSYPNNFLDPKLLGATVVPIPLLEADNYQFTLQALEELLTVRTKMVVITHPNNPTSSVFRRESIEALCRFVVDNDLILISDQAFEDHIFDGIEFVSPCTLPGMWERTLTVCSMSKGYALSGLRIGYIYAPDTIMDVLYGAAVNVQGAPCTVACAGALAALTDDTILPDYFSRFDRRRKIAYNVLSSVPGVQMRMSESGIVSWLNVRALGSSAEVAARLEMDARIMVNDGSFYGSHGEGYLRIVTGCFLEDEDACRRFERIRSVLSAMAQEKGIF